MLLFRWILMFLLLGCIASFGLYTATGEERYRNIGLRILRWVVLAGLGFFGVLVLERVL